MAIVSATRQPPSRTYTIVFQAGVVALVLVCWEALTAGKVISRNQLPTLTATVSAIGRIFTHASTRNDIWVTLSEVIAAFAIAAGLGLLGGFALGEWGQTHYKVRHSIESALSAVLSTPKFIVLPVLVLLIQAGYWEKVIYACSDGLIIAIVGAAAAAGGRNPDFRLLALSYRMTRRQVFAKIFIPEALFPVLESLRLAMVLVVSGVILAEMYISSAGMGLLIFKAGATFNLPQLVGGVVIVSAMALVLNAAFRLLERAVKRGHV